MYCIYRCFNTQNSIYPFQNLSLDFILKIFLKFRKFQPRHSYKIYSYKKKRVYCDYSHHAVALSSPKLLILSKLLLPRFYHTANILSVGSVYIQSRTGRSDISCCNRLTIILTGTTKIGIVRFWETQHTVKSKKLFS